MGSAGSLAHGALGPWLGSLRCVRAGGPADNHWKGGYSWEGRDSLHGVSFTAASLPACGLFPLL